MKYSFVVFSRGGTTEILHGKIVSNSSEFLSEAVTNEDGRTDKQILSSVDFKIGEYELLFHCGDYIARHNQIIEGVSKKYL